MKKICLKKSSLKNKNKKKKKTQHFTVNCYSEMLSSFSIFLMLRNQIGRKNCKIKTFKKNLKFKKKRKKKKQQQC
jgi:hypothetical protein